MTKLMTPKDVASRIDWAIHCLTEALKDVKAARGALEEGEIGTAETRAGFAISEIAEATQELELAYAELGLLIEENCNG